MEKKRVKFDYSAVVRDHARHPRNMGVIKNPDAAGIAGGPCGDEVEFFIKIGKRKEGKNEVEFIEDIKFETMGCAAAIATASTIGEMAIGKTLDEALKISYAEVAKELDGLPKEKMHCSVLSQQGLKAAIEDYKNKKGKAD